MVGYLKYILIFNYIILIWAQSDELNTKVVSTKMFMFWPNATVPFYINRDHFDKEQTITLLTALANFASKTCLKFSPVMEAPITEHVMTFVNPEGIKRCKIDTAGHSALGPHEILLGYECLKSPDIEMMIMRALGFPFEHNRMSRDLFINVIIQNVEPGAVELFTKDAGLPVEMRAIPYDINSVMHFGEREYSKNGHKTISSKRDNVQQNRVGLTMTDIKKIELVYGPECLKRDRQEKIEMCQSYPGGVLRKKRQIESTTLINLRVNRNITPSAIDVESIAEEATEQEKQVKNSLKELGVSEQAQEVINQVYKVSAEALKIAQEKYCNKTRAEITPFTKPEKGHSFGTLAILESVAEHVRNTVENALGNLTVFCQEPGNVDAYLRACLFSFDNRCRPTYYSTRSGHIYSSTQHRPWIRQSTKHKGQAASYSYDRVAWRARNDSSENTGTTEQIKVRRKREAEEGKKKTSIKDKLKKEKTLSKKDLKEKRRFFESRTSKENTQSNTDGSDISQELEQNKVKEEGIAIKSEEISDDSQQNDQGKKISLFGDTTFKDSLSSEVEVTEKSPPKVAKITVNDNNISDDNDSNESVVRTTTDSVKYPLVSDSVGNKNKYSSETKSKLKVRHQKQSPAVPKTSSFDDRGVPVTLNLSKLSKEFYYERRWPEGVVRYVISPLEGFNIPDMRARLHEVGDILKKKTCVRLQEMTEEQAQDYEDYLVLDASPDYITGRVGGRQNFGCIELFEGGQHRQHTAMMVMAMLGFYFEVSRYDRDKFIRVHMRHVRPDKLHHFEKIRDESTFDLPYDFESATHPAWQFWRKIGKTGISTVATFKAQDPKGTVMRALGHHNKLLSDSDIIKINTVYGVDCFTTRKNN